MSQSVPLLHPIPILPDIPLFFLDSGVRDFNKESNALEDSDKEP